MKPLNPESTPPGRVSLNDLLGRASGPADEDAGEDSPEDRILWNNIRPKTFNPELSPLMPRNARKRARSSSPVSSPAHAEHTTPAQPLIDRKKLAEAMNSPHADPTLQLWDRLAGGTKGAATTPVSTTSTGLAQFMISSSPRPARAGVSGSASRMLRRTVSSGLSWPKRRRLDKSESAGSSKSVQSNSNGFKSSFVSALLDTVENVQESPTDQSEEREVPPAASPSPAKRAADPVTTSFPAGTAQDSRAPAAASCGALPPGDTESDYGDDDFLDDDDTLLQLEASMAAIEPTSTHANAAKPSQPAELVDLLEDDFDDLDDDTVMEAAAGIMAEFEGTAAKDSPPVDSKNNDVSADQLLDDDFGDDFGGDFDFDAAEFAATQSVKPSNSQLAAVRSRL